MDIAQRLDGIDVHLDGEVAQDYKDQPLGGQGCLGEVSFEQWWGVRQGASFEERNRAEAIWHAARVATLMELGAARGRVYNEIAAELLDADPRLLDAVEEWFARMDFTRFKGRGV